MEKADDSLKNHVDTFNVFEQTKEFLKKLDDWRVSNSLVIQIGPLQDRNRQCLTIGCALKGFPQRMSRVAAAKAYASVHDMRLSQVYFTIRLWILMSLLGNPYVSTSCSVHEIVDLEIEAARAAELIASFAEILNPNLWPTYGYMFEIWSLETVICWHQKFGSVNSGPGLGNYGQSHLHLCSMMLNRIRAGMKREDGSGDTGGSVSPFHRIEAFSI
jgi:hypothetical protein